MDVRTIQQLNDINRQFYATVAEDFDTTRGKPWPGWRRVFQRIQTLAVNPLRVLDVGCGNGRFGLFVARELDCSMVYHGLDNNPALLDHARAELAAFDNVQAQLEVRDIVSAGLPDGNYDVVVLFGVLHHIPGAAQRQALMQGLAARVAPGGLLAFAAWRFYDFKRFRERIVPWSSEWQVEPGDYLLDWRRGANALRYCHHVDDAEFSALIAATGLQTLATYRADGQTSDGNLYAILTRA